MRVHRTLSSLLLAALLVAAFVPLSQSVRVAQAQATTPATNLLQNPGFEGVFAPFNADAKRLVAPGWTPWNIARLDSDPSYLNNTPDYQSSTARVHGGSVSQEFFTFYATYIAGIYQRVAVTPGTKVRFGLWVNVWSTAYEDPARSEGPGEVKLEVGIDPNGGTDSTVAGIVWSPITEYYDQWRELSVEATAAADNVTVFLRAAPRQPTKFNNIYVDDASLMNADAIPTLTATAITAATLTPTVEIPTLTPIPTLPSATETSLPRPSPTRNGTIPPPPSETLTSTVTTTAIPATNTATVVPATSTSTATATRTPVPASATVLVPTVTRTAAPATLTPTGVPSLVPSLVPSFVPSLIPSATVGSGEFPYTIKHTVVFGNTLSDLAVLYGSTVEAIVKANGIEDAGLISVGQVLDIPVRTPPFPTATPTHVTTAVPTQPGAGLGGPTNGGIGTYIVQPGDDLSKIAALYRTTPYSLARLNGILNPNLIFVGQVLVVPGAGNNVGGRPPAPKPVLTHIVQPGETLYSIALHYGVNLNLLMQANGIINPNVVYVGQILRLP